MRPHFHPLLPLTAAFCTACLPAKAGYDFPFSGTVSFLADNARPFSGALVRFHDSRGRDRAMILTNGHGVQEAVLTPGKAVANLPSAQKFRIVPPGGGPSTGTLDAAHLLYAVMGPTDIALYGLKESYDEIEKKYGTRPLDIARRGPAGGEQVSVVSGRWRYVYDCAAAHTVPLLEEGGALYIDAIKYAPGCRMTGGVSGSPLVSKETGEIVGIHNTTVTEGKSCAVHTACERTPDGLVRSYPDAAYAQQVFWLYNCRDEKGALNFRAKNCRLPQP